MKIACFGHEDAAGCTLNTLLQQVPACAGTRDGQDNTSWCCGSCRLVVICSSPVPLLRALEWKCLEGWYLSLQDSCARRGSAGPKALLPVCRGGYGAVDLPTAEWREAGMGLVHIMQKSGDRNGGQRKGSRRTSAELSERNSRAKSEALWRDRLGVE